MWELSGGPRSALTAPPRGFSTQVHHVTKVASASLVRRAGHGFAAHEFFVHDLGTV
jgi:hypothetical protein